MRYMCGTEVQQGDVIYINLDQRRMATILLVIQAGTADATEWSLPNGGVVIQLEKSRITQESIEDDEDIDFVRRASEGPSKSS
jgi:hypothetical protein